MSENKERKFGQDAGLIHEAVVTLRKVAADIYGDDADLRLREFFATLAHNEKFANSILFRAGVLLRHDERFAKGGVDAVHKDGPSGRYNPLPYGSAERAQ